MTQTSRTLACLLGLVVFCACAACAQSVVVVQPGDMNGWNYVTASGANAFITNILPDPVGAPNPSDAAFTGAFYGATMDAQNPAGQVWFGTDAYSGDPSAVPPVDGVLCSSIDALSYWTYTEPSGWQMGTRHYAKEPFMLQIAINKGSGPANRILIYRPWGLREPMNGQTWSNYGVWQFHDCMAPVPRIPDPRADKTSPYYDWRYDPSDPHYISSLAGPGTVAADPSQPGWYEAVTGFYGDWDFWFGPGGWYPNARIAKAGGTGTGWDAQIAYTGTGYSMNFQVGARKEVTKIYHHPDYLDLATKPAMEQISIWEEAYGWWQESVRFKGYVDDFTIGINGETTRYDFQGGTTPMTVCLTSNKAIKDYCADRGKVKFYYKVHGRVVADGWSGDEFILEDASGQRIKVVASQHGMFADDYVSAAGKVDTSTTPPTLTTSYERLNYYPEF